MTVQEQSNHIDNNWLHQGSSNSQWLISPNSSNASLAFFVSGSGWVDNVNYIVTNSDPFSPVMALKADVMVTGSGTQSDPYVMQ